MCMVNQARHNQVDQTECTPITSTAAENHYGSSNSTNSATPEQFEMIDSEKNSGTYVFHYVMHFFSIVISHTR